jgi:hypothetical protein
MRISRRQASVAPSLVAVLLAALAAAGALAGIAVPAARAESAGAAATAGTAGAAATAAAPARRPIAETDLFRFVWVADPRISTDG